VRRVASTCLRGVTGDPNAKVPPPPLYPVDWPVPFDFR
jgi:hypothetical protein